jgi:hypothetical protein
LARVMRGVVAIVTLSLSGVRAIPDPLPGRPARPRRY